MGKQAYIYTRKDGTKVDVFSEPVAEQIRCVPYDGNEAKFKSGKHKFSVDVHWDVARSFEVEAESREEAQAIIQSRVDKGEICVWSDGFEATDDVEVTTSGEETKDGEIFFW